MIENEQPETPVEAPEEQAETPKPRARRRPMKTVAAVDLDAVEPYIPPTKSNNKNNARKKPVRKTVKKGWKHDWPMIRKHFVEGILPEGEDIHSDSREFLTLKALGERMNVPYDSIRARASEERWTDQRQDYMARLAKSRQMKRIAELSKESYEFDASTLKTAKLGMAMVTARMSEIAREVQEAQRRRDQALQLASSGFDIDPRDLQTVIDARELSTLAGAAVAWQQLGQKALGTDITRLEIQHDIQQNIEVDVEVTTIAAELSRDDPDRLAAFLQAAKRAGLLEAVMQGDDSETPALEAGMPDDDGVIDAEIVEDTA